MNWFIEIGKVVSRFRLGFPDARSLDSTSLKPALFRGPSRPTLTLLFEPFPILGCAGCAEAWSTATSRFRVTTSTTTSNKVDRAQLVTWAP